MLGVSRRPVTCSYVALLVPYRMGFHEDAKPGWNFAFLVRPLARHGCRPRATATATATATGEGGAVRSSLTAEHPRWQCASRPQ